MKNTAPLSIDGGRAQIEDMMEQGVPFAHVEDAIDAAQLPSDHKAALWLLAWSLRDPVLQHHDARLTLGLITASVAGRSVVDSQRMQETERLVTGSGARTRIRRDLERGAGQA
jgi:hypothetical protein